MKTQCTKFIPRSICQNVASLANLKALHIVSSGLPAEELEPLNQVKNLKHLNVTAHGSAFSATLQSILRNSLSTMQSLYVSSDYYTCQFLANWEKNLLLHRKSNPTIEGTGHDFTSLRCLHLVGVEVDDEFIKEFHKAIDLSKLRELACGGFSDTACQFYPSLTSLITSYQASPFTPIDMRTLTLDMSDNEYSHNAGQLSALF